MEFDENYNRTLEQGTIFTTTQGPTEELESTVKEEHDDMEKYLAEMEAFNKERVNLANMIQTFSKSKLAHLQNDLMTLKLLIVSYHLKIMIKNFKKKYQHLITIYYSFFTCQELF